MEAINPKEWEEIAKQIISNTNKEKAIKKKKALKIKEACNLVLDELLGLSDEEFKEKLNEHRGNSDEDIEQLDDFELLLLQAYSLLSVSFNELQSWGEDAQKSWEEDRLEWIKKYLKLRGL